MAVGLDLAIAGAGLAKAEAMMRVLVTGAPSEATPAQPIETVDFSERLGRDYFFLCSYRVAASRFLARQSFGSTRSLNRA